MLVFFLQLLLAHLIGDFLFQPNRWVKERSQRKITSKYLYFHLAVHALALAVFLKFDMQYRLGFFTIIISHGLLDILKSYCQEKTSKIFLFLADQAAHLAVLVAVSYFYYPFVINGEILLHPKVLLTATALLLLTSVLAVVIKTLLSAWDDAIAQPAKSKSTQELLQRSSFRDYGSINAGKYIGIIERLFVFLFILMNFWEGIGFLLAAKSIFRVGNLTQTRDKNLTEYILIGTLLSFGLAIAIGLGYKFALGFL